MGAMKIFDWSLRTVKGSCTDPAMMLCNKVSSVYLNTEVEATYQDLEKPPI
jgi:hypothetical protein